MKLNLKSKPWHGLIALIFLISSCSKDDAQPSISIPTVSTSAAASITTTTAIIGGNINSDGGSSIIEKGICYSTSPNPTVANSKVIDARSNTNTFLEAELSKLIGNTNYYAKAYATNAAGTAYGSEITFTTGNPIAIGELYGGGMIFYLDATGKHGLIVATSDQGRSPAWGCEGTNIPNTFEKNVGFGAANTKAILSVCNTANTAAAVCDNLVLNGYDDWYLPTLNELIELKSIYNGKGASIALSGGNIFWSSSQVVTGDNSYTSSNPATSENAAWAYLFHSSGNNKNPVFKSTINFPAVRAVRSF